MTATIRTVLLTLLALFLVLAGAGSAQAATGNRIGSLEAIIHGGSQLELNSCLYPDQNGGALFLAFIDNTSDEPAQIYTVTLHGAGGELLAEHTYTALQPGESDVFAVRVHPIYTRTIAEAGTTSCDSDG